MKLQFETGEQWLDGDVPVIWIAGELDLATREQVESRLTELATTQSSLIVDLRRCTFIDSSALSLFTQLHRDLASRNGDSPRLALLVDNPDVGRSIELAGLDRLIPIYTRPETALSGLRGHQASGA